MILTPGADDVLALIMALNSPELEILALTTVEGNARLEHTTANALRLLAYMGRSDIPVYEGESIAVRGWSFIMPTRCMERTA